MKIAVIAPTHIPARRANTIQVMKMSQAFTDLGHQVRLIVPGLPNAAEGEWQALERLYGLHAHFPIDWLPASQSLRRYDYALSAVRLARRWGADLLYTRLPQAAAAGSQSGTATVFEVHDMPHGSVGPWMFRRFLNGHCAERLVVITRALYVALDQRFGVSHLSVPAVIAPDGVDLQRYTNLPEPEAARRMLRERPDGRLNLPPERFTAGYTGHLYAGRGGDLLLELATRLPEVNFLLAGGEQADISRMEAAARGRRLSNLQLVGFVPNADLPLYQAACETLLMPYQEQVAASSGGDIGRYLSPMKLFEYLASGRAIVSSNLPVLCEVLTPETALLLPPGDIHAWTDALRRLQADAELRQSLGQAGQAAAQQYSWEARAKRILEA